VGGISLPLVVCVSASSSAASGSIYLNLFL
jgi:hypothetical protein